MGLCAVTQQPKLLEDELLSQFNTFFILGLADEKDRNMLRSSAKQDISAQGPEIQTLMPGECLIVNLAAPFAIPAMIDLYSDVLRAASAPARAPVGRRGERSRAGRLDGTVTVAHGRGGGVLEIPGPAPELAQDPDQGIHGVRIHSRLLEDLAVYRSGGLLRQLTTRGRDLGQGGSAVGGMRKAGDQTLLLQAVDGIGDAGRMDLEPGTDLAERQSPGPAEQEQHQHLVAGEGEPQRSEQGIDPGQVDLLGPEDRRHGRHPLGGVGPAVGSPLPARLGDRIEAQGAVGSHGMEVR